MSRTHSPAKLSLAIWISALALALGAQEMSAATVTYIVGTCKKSGTHFSTIQSALDASPAPDTPGLWPIRTEPILRVTSGGRNRGATSKERTVLHLMQHCRQVQLLLVQREGVNIVA